MKNSHVNRFGFLGVMAFLACTASMTATTISYSGTLPNPNALFEVQFTITQTENVTIQTTGIPNTNVIVPVLWLFNSTDTVQLDKNDPPFPQNAIMTETNLAAGTYDIILSTFDQHYCAANTNCNGVVYGNTGWSYNGSFFNAPGNFNLTITSSSSMTDNTLACEDNS